MRLFRPFSGAAFFSILALGAVLAAFGVSQAQAQFVCGGSGNGGEPQAGGLASATGSVFNTACGQLAGATGTGISANTALGNLAGADGNGSFNTAIGGSAASSARANARGNGSENTAIGSSANASGDGSVNTASGFNANAGGGGGNNTATGSLANASGVTSHNTATGVQANASGDGSSNTAIGFNANASGGGGNNTAVGNGSTATGLNSSAFGNGASATFANSAAFGNGATATRDNQHVFGTASNTYTLAGVTSAASLAAQTGPTRVVTTDAFGNLAAASFTPQDISGLQQNVSVLQTQMRQAFEGTAIAIALGGAALPSDKKFAISTNWGNFRGQNAVGVAAQFRLSNYAVANVGVGGGFAQGGIGSRAGVTLAW